MVSTQNLHAFWNDRRSVILRQYHVQGEEFAFLASCVWGRSKLDDRCAPIKVWRVISGPKMNEAS